VRLTAAARGLVLAALLAAAPAVPGPARAQEAIVVLQEHRAREGPRGRVRHLAVLKNTAPRPVDGLRVTVELYDYFGRLLWAQTGTPEPARLGPGQTATLSLPTPHLEAHRTTRYRFHYRARQGGEPEGRPGSRGAPTPVQV
jgi:hypothetical protein